MEIFIRRKRWVRLKKTLVVSVWKSMIKFEAKIGLKTEKKMTHYWQSWNRLGSKSSTLLSLSGSPWLLFTMNNDTLKSKRALSKYAVHIRPTSLLRVTYTRGLGYVVQLVFAQTSVKTFFFYLFLTLTPWLKHLCLREVGLNSCPLICNIIFCPKIAFVIGIDHEKIYRT